MQKVLFLISILLGSVVNNTYPMDVTLAEDHIEHINSPSVEALRRESKVFNDLEDVCQEKQLPLKSVTPKGFKRLCSFLNITKSVLKEKKSNTKLVKKKVKEKSARHDLPTMAEDAKLFDFLAMDRYSVPSIKVMSQKLLQSDAWDLFLNKPEQIEKVVTSPIAHELKNEFYHHIELPRLYSSIEVDKKIIKTKNHPYLKKMVLSEDAQCIFAIDQNNLLAWDAQSGQRTTKINFTETITDMALSRTKNEVILGTSNGQLVFCNSKTKNMIQRTAHDTAIKFVAAAPNNVYCATAAANGQVKIWNHSGDNLQTFNGHATPITAIEFSPDGMMLATGSEDAHVCIWNVQTGTLEKKMCESNYPISKLQFSTHGNKLLVVSDRAAQIAVYPTGTSGESTVWSGADRLSLVSGAKDLQTVVCDDSEHCALLKMDGSKCGKNLKISQPDSVSFTDNDTALLFGSQIDDLMHLIDASNGRCLKTFAGGKVVQIQHNKALVKLASGDIGIYHLQPLLDAQHNIKELDLKQQFVVGQLNNHQMQTTITKKDRMYPIFNDLPKVVQKLLINNKKVILKK